MYVRVNIMSKELSEYTEDDLYMLQYFHEEKNDHTRYGNWNKIKDSVKRDFPKLLLAIDNYELAKDTMDHQFRQLELKE